jgi:hypothetical protein
MPCMYTAAVCFDAVVRSVAVSCVSCADWRTAEAVQLQQ